MSISSALLKLGGWKSEGTIPDDNVCVILAAPHTSIWDFVIGYLYFRSQKKRLRVMIKKEAFFFPLGALLRALGAFPIDRKHPNEVVMGIIHKMNAGEKFPLVICPEGTRKAVKKWKTGYHMIAKGTGAKVYLAYFDYPAKRVGILSDPVELSDNAREDTERIQAIYESMHLTGLRKDGYVTK